MQHTTPLTAPCFFLENSLEEGFAPVIRFPRSPPPPSLLLPTHLPDLHARNPNLLLKVLLLRLCSDSLDILRGVLSGVSPGLT